MKTLLVRISTFSAVTVAAVLAVNLAGRDEAFLSAPATALAALSLLLALPLVDSALAGGSARPETAGLCAGIGIGFFIRQGEFSEALSRGADRILAVAFAISLALLARRVWIRRRPQRA